MFKWVWVFIVFMSRKDRLFLLKNIQSQINRENDIIDANGYNTWEWEDMPTFFKWIAKHEH